MDILLVTLLLPYPINDGGKSGTFRMVDEMRKANNVTFICPESNKKDLKELKKLWPDVNIKTFQMPPEPKGENIIIKAAKKLLGRSPKLSKEDIMRQEMVLNGNHFENYYFGNLLNIFRIELKKKYDFVQIEFIELAPLIHFIPEKMPTVFVHHEIRYKRMEREQATLTEKDPADDWKINNIKKFEICLLNQYDKVICLTQTDFDILSEDGVVKSKLQVSPLPMQFVKHNTNQPFKSKNQLLFLGPDQHYPNLDGINWFLSHCWNDLKKAVPNLKLYITGHWSDEKIAWFSSFEGVHFKGFVPTLNEVMEGSVMIVPLRIGSGMRMKILEGVSYHVPIVSTTIGAEGLPMVHNENCMIADNPKDFTQSVISLLNSPDLQSKFINNAKIILEENYSLEECNKTRESIYQEL